MITERQARIEELPYLQQRINDSDNEKVRLYMEVDGKIVPLSMVWVTEKDGKLQSMLNLRLIWQAEPQFIFPEVTDKGERRRIAYLQPKAMETWLADRTKNRTGIYSYFMVTKSRAWAKLAQAFGCLRIYKGCMTFGKDL